MEEEKTNIALILDIGKFEISYAAVNQVTRELISFKISPTQPLDEIYNDDVAWFMSKVIEKTTETIKKYKVEDVIVNIPSKDLLLSFEKPPTVDRIQDELKSIGVDLYEDGVKHVIQMPIYNQNTGGVVVPISIYDKTFDRLIRSVVAEDITTTPYVLGRAEIHYGTAITRLLEVSKRTMGDVAIMDLSFSGTRILVVKGGMPYTYKDFKLSGKELIYEVEEVVGSTVGAIRAISRPGSENIKGVSNYLVAEFAPINALFNKYGVEKVITYGGISNMNLSNYINCDVLSGLNHALDIYPGSGPVLHRLTQSMLMKKENDFLSSAPIDFLNQLNGQASVQ